MNIVFGSTSTDKLSILKMSLDGKLPLWSIEGVEVESGISDQPLSIEETEKGAINRAKAALKAKPQANLAVGLEGGLEDRNGIYWLIGVAAFWDGHQLVVEKGKQLPLPHVVSQKIKQGGQFGQLIREYQLTAEPHEQERIDQLISRELVLASAIKKALSRYRQSKSMSIVSEISALFASDSGPELLFKISAVLIGLFFALRAIIAVASPILGLMQMLQPWFDFAGFSQLVSLLIVPGLAAFTLGIWRLRSKLSLNQLPKSGFFISSIAFSPYILLWAILTTVALTKGLHNSWAIISAWYDIIISLAILFTASAILSMWLLLQWLRKAMTIATSTTLLLWFGFTGLTFTGWITFQQIDFPNPFLAPLYVAGLSWSVGLWQLTKAIDVYSQPKPLVDMAKSVDRA